MFYSGQIVFFGRDAFVFLSFGHSFQLMGATSTVGATSGAGGSSMNLFFKYQTAGLYVCQSVSPHTHTLY